ncbi:hypothetical protein [Carnobacterium maltaromaticum]|uniref:hypothetical protein n=1 Tax=Carnobacterium maltaromaticum TaxID=2751 RepID=UPI0039AFB0C5
MQKQYDTLPTGLPEWDGTGIDDFDLPDYMFKDPIHYSEEWFNFIEEKVKDENLADEYKQIMINIMHKKHGVDVRLSLTIFVYIIAHGFTVAVDEFSSLSKLIQDRVSELEKEYEALLNEWKNTIGGLTVDSEVINARIDLRGFVYKTLKERLDAMQAVSDKLNPVSEVFSIEHNQNCYPVVRVLAFENGLGIGPLGVNLGGSNTITVNCDAEYMGRNSLKVKVPLVFAMTNPTTERISPNEYLLVEGIKSLIIEVGTKTEANVETFVTREILSDFNTPPKIAGSNVENANNSKWNHKVSLGLPSDPWNSANQTYINMLYKLDNVAFTATTAAGASGMIPQMLTEFNALWILEKNFPQIFKNATTTAEKVAIAKNLIKKFQYKVWAKASGPTGTLCTHSLFNPLSKSWGTTVTSTGNNILERGIGSANTATPAYLNPDGNYYFASYAEASNGIVASSVSIDYTNITITARVPFSKI